MIARTINQKRVVKVNKKIKPLGKRMIKWAKENVLENKAFQSPYGKINCLKCGHTWVAKTLIQSEEKTKCPNCKRVVIVVTTQLRTGKSVGSFSFVLVADEYQLIRTFEIRAFYKTKKEPIYYITEGFRIYIGADGKREVMGRLRAGMMYVHNAVWHGAMDLRSPKVIDKKYHQEGVIHPCWNLKDFVKKVGFSRNDRYLSMYNVSKIIHSVLNDSRKETLLKAGRIRLFDFSIETSKIEKYWGTVKILLRNDYKPPNVRSYFDLIEALDFSNKDLLNHKYVCPSDFHKAHDFWINKRHRIIEKERKALEKEELLATLLREEENRILFERRMDKFKNLKITHLNLLISPFLKLIDVCEAGEKMSHCIFKTASYWQDEDNLLFGAYHNGKLVETTQYSLSRASTLHSYGVHNTPSDFSGEIVKMINNNKHQILSCLKKKNKKKRNVLVI